MKDPVLQLGYLFLKTSNSSDHIATCLAAAVGTSYGSAVVVEQKGGVCQYAVSHILRFLQEVGISGRCVLQTGSEVGIADLAKAVAAKCEGHVIARTTIPGSHVSNGSAEHMINKVQAQARSLRVSAEVRLKRPILARSNITPWLVRHSSWLLSRSQQRSDGRTGFRIVFGHEYTGEICEFGELVLGQRQADAKDKLSDV